LGLEECPDESRRGRLERLRYSKHMRALILLGALAAISVSAEDQTINWRGDYRAALREAKASGKPLLVEFRCEA